GKRERLRHEAVPEWRVSSGLPSDLPARQYDTGRACSAGSSESSLLCRSGDLYRQHVRFTLPGSYRRWLTTLEARGSEQYVAAVEEAAHPDRMFALFDRLRERATALPGEARWSNQVRRREAAAARAARAAAMLGHAARFLERRDAAQRQIDQLVIVQNFRGRARSAILHALEFLSVYSESLHAVGAVQ